MLPRVERSPCGTDLLSCLAALEWFPPRRRLHDDVSESASVFWKPLTLCFEARSLPPLLTFSVIIEAFHVCQPRPASTLVPDQPLVSGNLWVMSPGDCLIVPSHRFLSAGLSPAEAGGISEPRRKTSWFLPRVCFLRHLFF